MASGDIVWQTGTAVAIFNFDLNWEHSSNKWIRSATFIGAQDSGVDQGTLTFTLPETLRVAGSLPSDPFVFDPSKNYDIIIKEH